MKPVLLVALGLLLPLGSPAATTINSANKFAYGANTGWQNWQGDTHNGVVIGEYVCSGYFWAANVGWIHLGDNTPANGIRYQNNSANDYGVNHDGLGNLRGYAWGANIGWVNFESNGVPRVDFKTGALSGSAYSANCGWISLSNAFANLHIDRLQPGADSDGDGITDAWELGFTNTLTAFTVTSDSDGDGASDLEEHQADTNPLDADDFLKITSYTPRFGGSAETNTLAWTSRKTRCYQLDYTTNLNTGTPWVSVPGVVAPDSGTSTTLKLILPGAPLIERYFRVKALKPLAP